MYPTLWSSDEWSPLKEIIIGSLRGHEELRHYSHYIKDISVLKDIIDESQEGLDSFQSILENLNIKVYRPHGFCYNVRDCATVIEDTIVEASMRYKAEYIFLKALRPIFEEKVLEGAKLITAPKPTWRPWVNPTEPIFDGANICRLGKDLFMSINETANEYGRDWVIQNFNHLTHHYIIQGNRISHIDTTFVPLSDHTVMINQERVKGVKEIPPVFKDWNHIFINREDLVEEEVNLTSRCAGVFIGINTLSINNNTVCVNQSQVKLIEKLEKHNFNCIPIPLKHTRTLSGGLHCCTLDLLRTF